MKKIIYIPLVFLISIVFLSCSQQKQVTTANHSGKTTIKTNKKGNSAAQFTSREAIKSSPKYIKVNRELKASEQELVTSISENQAISVKPITTNSEKPLIAARQEFSPSPTTESGGDDLNTFNEQLKHAEKIKKYRRGFKKWGLFYSKTPPQESSLPEGGEVKQAQGFAIASLVLGLVGLFVAGIPLGILAVIFGGVALGRVKKYPGIKGKGLAIAGLVIGLVAIVGALVVLGSM